MTQSAQADGNSNKAVQNCFYLMQKTKLKKQKYSKVRPH